MHASADTVPGFLLLILVGAISAAINAVAGGGSLISFPTLTEVYAIHSVIANATNSVSLWPGSLSGALGFLNLLKRTGKYFKIFLVPTVAGSVLGAYLLVHTRPRLFNQIVPFLILLAALLLVFQPKIKAFATQGVRLVSPKAGMAIQFLVSLYGGYFGAGMGIMMLGAFALTMEGDIHELNAVKNWLGLTINLTASILFLTQGLVLASVAIPLTLGGLFGGFTGARLSQRVESDKLRLTIAVYGVAMAGFFLYQAWGK